MSDEIEIVAHDASWPQLFEAERTLLLRVLPADQVLAIEHAGSTAIAGLAAKPIIDIYLAVPSIARARAMLVAPIEALGYAYWADNPEPDRMFFVKGMPPYGARRTHHIHIAEPQSDAWQRPLLFRDYLLRTPDAAASYLRLKLDLASRHRHDREAYIRAKDAFVDDIIHRARRERP